MRVDPAWGRGWNWYQDALGERKETISGHRTEQAGECGLGGFLISDYMKETVDADEVAHF